MHYELTAQDRTELQARGMLPETIATCIQQFQQGFPPVQLERACTLGDGIIRIPAETTRLERLYAEAAAAGRLIKFVPASGAASRMFQLPLSFFQQPELLSNRTLARRATEGDADCQAFQRFLGQLDHFAFAQALRTVLRRDGYTLEGVLSQEQHYTLLTYLLTPTGLNYANLPKGLVPFHAYGDHSRTAFEEHLVEALEYVRDAAAIVRLHFTVAASHQQAIQTYLDRVRHRYAQRGAHLDISYSVQKPATDTIAVDSDNIPVRDSSGALVFRPGGHGALLENLADLQGDIIFIKNIDNVLPDRLKPDTYRYKKLLCGYLLHLQQQVFFHIAQLKASQPSTADGARIPIEAARRFAQDELSLVLPPDFERIPIPTQRDFLIEQFNRPLRACGVVKNTGEPGGGPFWVRQANGVPSLQIVESAQVDMTNAEQRARWQAATHFNPVDLVCGVRDYRGRPFPLSQFTDPATGLISEKSKDGHSLRALELPGLWNGAMTHWNTVFVEVPGSTFHPVKTVMDLLRPEHQSAPVPPLTTRLD